MAYKDLINMRLVSRDMRDIVDYYLSTNDGKKLHTAATKLANVFTILKAKISNKNEITRAKVLDLCQTITVETFISILDHLNTVDIASIVIVSENQCIINLECTTGNYANKHVDINIKSLKSGQISKKITYYNNNELINIVNDVV
jgi:hypothetical protein